MAYVQNVATTQYSYVTVERNLMLTLSYLTYLLIASLNVSVAGALFGWVYNAHKAECEHRARVFVQEQVEHHVQGPINECER